MNVDELKKNIVSMSADEFYNEFFISGDVWVFKKIYGADWFVQYDSFKKYIAGKLGVHYNNIGIAGSAKLGISLNPHKNFKAFDKESDVDIIVVSRHLFYEFWEQYLNDSYNMTTRLNSIKYVSFCIFRRFLTLEYFRNNEYYKDWKRKTDGFEKDIQLRFRIDNEIHYRIFESWDAVKMYYLSGINCIKTVGEGCENGFYNEDDRCVAT